MTLIVSTEINPSQLELDKGLFLENISQNIALLYVLKVNLFGLGIAKP